VLSGQLNRFKFQNLVIEIYIAQTKATKNKELKDDLMHMLRENRLTLYANHV